MAETLYLTATGLSELLVGIDILPSGKRKQGLDAALRKLLDALFGSRILPFDQKAAIAAVHGFSVATRDTAPFVAAGVHVINPWEV